MKKRSFGLLALSTLLCFEGLPIKACERNIKETTTINTMNNSETRMIQNIETTFEILYQSEDPITVAKKFGSIKIVPGSSTYEVKPFNTDLESVSILARKESSSLPYSAYRINLTPKRDTKILVSAVQKHFGEYLELPRAHYSVPKTMSISVELARIPSKSFAIYIDYDSDKDFTEATISNVIVEIQ
jgi:hypothetical protein